MSYAKDREAFMSVAGRYGLTRDKCAAIIRHATALETSNLRQCNEEMSDATAHRLELSDRRYEELIRKHLAGTGIRIVESGDPRGYAVALLFPRESQHHAAPYNTWGGEERGYGVPTRYS